jgi:hypothetical protein
VIFFWIQSLFFLINRTADFSVNTQVAGSRLGRGAKKLAKLHGWAFSFLQAFVPKAIEQSI